MKPAREAGRIQAKTVYLCARCFCTLEVEQRAFAIGIGTVLVVAFCAFGGQHYQQPDAADEWNIRIIQGG